MDQFALRVTGPRSQLPYLLWLSGLLIFLAIAVGAHFEDEFYGDRAISEEFQELTFLGSSQLEEAADTIGSTQFVLASGVFLAAAFWLLGDRMAALLAPTVLIWRVIGAPIKEVVRRERPEPEEAVLREFPSGFSFPSGHALGAALLFGLLIYVAERRLSGATRRVVQMLALAAALLVGSERVYDGAHWPSDVLGGYLLGVVILSAVIFLCGRLLRTRTAGRGLPQ